MKKLIVLIDFSPYTQTILKLAFEWQKSYDISLKFIYKIPGLAPTLANSSSKDQIIEFEKKEAGKAFTDAINKLGVSHGDVDFLAIDKQLTHFLSEETSQDDILLLGLKGTGFLKKLLIGSTATDIINHLNRLIIALPKSIEHAIPTKLALACHVKYPLNEQALSFLLNTLGSSVVEIELLTILTDKEERGESEAYLNKLKDKLSIQYRCTVKLYEGADAFEIIKTRYRNFPDNYLVLQKGSRTLNDQLFRKFFINDLVHDGQTPLMVLPCEEE
ncbi:universal stress protein [Cyclobacterium jeungdonense]|uniref:Universal stress protein n=1 Tax=Cyclobacterium jeungdonense TaxID=708087 RepID=A0ABT8C4U0_9BACT|nr:universal stress protein [Cyclobacterium jeungdonense]MDN3687321.1 universal stress protein [Cyclobacterium jeungdonense]